MVCNLERRLGVHKADPRHIRYAHPDAVLDLSGCPKLESLTVLTFAESALAKIRLRKGLSQLRELKIYDENNKDYSHLVEIEYVE